jgi:hypothetical protein
MFDRFGPSLKNRTQLEETRFDMNRSDRDSGRYVIPMHRKNFWTNKWMQDPRKNFCRLQVHHYDPNAQYKKGWGSFKRKRGLTLCYSCRTPRHIAKESLGRGPICLCCKAIDHEVLDFPTPLPDHYSVTTTLPRQGYGVCDASMHTTAGFSIVQISMLRYANSWPPLIGVSMIVISQA